MLLMLDNYDSFTYNLVQYLGELGQDVRVFRNDEITVEEVGKLNPRHIVISPGPCTPNEAGISVPLIHEFAGKIPILGVCLGHQALGQALPAGWRRQGLVWVWAELLAACRRYPGASNARRGRSSATCARRTTKSRSSTRRSRSS